MEFLNEIQYRGGNRWTMVHMVGPILAAPPFPPTPPTRTHAGLPDTRGYSALVQAIESSVAYTVRAALHIDQSSRRSRSGA